MFLLMVLRVGDILELAGSPTADIIRVSSWKEDILKTWQPAFNDPAKSSAAAGGQW